MEFSKTKVLGKGSYGVVYLATMKDDQFVAIKSANLEHSLSLLKEKRVLKEFLGCKEIVQCFDGFISIESHQKFYNLSLEYAQGGTLKDLMKESGGKLPEPMVQYYTRMLLKGLRKIHKRGFVHGDFKPRNILVFPNGDGTKQLKIADFGKAKVAGDAKRYGDFWKNKFRATPFYMSPESVGLGLIEPPLDIWSLGCVVIEMFTGRLAWWDIPDLVCLSMHLAYLKLPPTIPKNMSEKGKNFLRMCFFWNPNKRWTAKMLLKHPFVIDQLPTAPNMLSSPPQSEKISSPRKPLDGILLRSECHSFSDSPCEGILPSPGWCSFSTSTSEDSSPPPGWCSFSSSSSSSIYSPPEYPWEFGMIDKYCDSS